MIKGIGCDFVNIARIERAISKARFMEKAFTPSEQFYLQSKGNQSAAGIWAAKEAISKALGTGFVGFTLTDIEIGHNENGQPYVMLHNGAKGRIQQLKAKQICVSISHEQDMAMAFAVID